MRELVTIIVQISDQTLVWVYWRDLLTDAMQSVSLALSSDAYRQAIYRAMRDKSVAPTIERLEGNLKILRMSRLIDLEITLTPLREGF